MSKYALKLYIRRGFIIFHRLYSIAAISQFKVDGIKLGIIPCMLDKCLIEKHGGRRAYL